MKIFLSSTYEDLAEHRAKAANAIERLGQQGVRMEVFGARPDGATTVCFAEIESADMFVGIYAHRYGHIPNGAHVSITEQEFDFARDRAKPLFCFFVAEDFPWNPIYVEHDAGHRKLLHFRRRVSDTLVRDVFSTPEDLAYKVSTALGRYLLTSKLADELRRVPKAELATTERGRHQVARRAERLRALTSGARILIVNDVPVEMKHVVHILQELGMIVRMTTSTEEALAAFETDEFDVAISDMRRGAIVDAGVQFLVEARRRSKSTPTIFTVGMFEPGRGTPAFAFGITNRVDELLNLVLDALERVRG